MDGSDHPYGPVTVETYQWFVRNADRISDAYAIVICDEAHTALGEKTSACIRRWPEPVFIGMTATGALIARHVADLFPTQTSRFDLAQAARRGVIAPLRCIRIPPGPGVRTIAKVPLRRGEVDQDFDQEELAKLLDQEPFNVAVADLYRSRFRRVPGVVYTAGVRHANNVAASFRAAGINARAVSGETPKRELAEILAAFERGEVDVLCNAMLLAEGWNSPRATICMHLAPTASRRVYQQRVGPGHPPRPGEGGRAGDRLRPSRHDARRDDRHPAQPARPRRVPRRRDRGRARAARSRQASARRAPRGARLGRSRAAPGGAGARALADRRGEPELLRAARLGCAGRSAGDDQQLAPGEGDDPARPGQGAAPSLPAHLRAAQPQPPAAAEGACGSGGAPRCRRLRRLARGGGNVAARRAARRRQGAAPGAGGAADRASRSGPGVGLAPRRRHSRCARGVRRAALAGDQAALGAVRQLVRASPRAKRAPHRPRGSPAGPPPGDRAAGRLGRAHPGGRGGVAGGSHEDGPEALSSRPRAAS